MRITVTASVYILFMCWTLGYVFYMHCAITIERAVLGWQNGSVGKDDCCQTSFGPTWQKERTDSHKLSSHLPVCTERKTERKKEGGKEDKIE